MIGRKTTSPPAIDLPCLCALLRKVGRVATQRYNAALKPTGLRITQFSLLMNIRRNPQISVTELSALMHMDQTTITRNLKVLEKKALIRIFPDPNDQRVRKIQITHEGKKTVKQSMPSWISAQEKMVDSIGFDQAVLLVQSLNQLINTNK
jgi:DNA-binding MarR family transcriptional regulator